MIGSPILLCCGLRERRENPIPTLATRELPTTLLPAPSRAQGSSAVAGRAGTSPAQRRAAALRALSGAQAGRGEASARDQNRRATLGWMEGRAVPWHRERYPKGVQFPRCERRRATPLLGKSLGPSLAVRRAARGSRLITAKPEQLRASCKRACSGYCPSCSLSLGLFVDVLAADTVRLGLSLCRCLALLVSTLANESTAT